MKKAILLLSLVCIGLQSIGQTAKIKDTVITKDTVISVPVSIRVPFSTALNKAQYDTLRKTFYPPGDVYDLTNSLPKGYVTNATVDYSSYLQDGFTKHLNVKLPNFPVLVNTTLLPNLAFTLQSNASVSFQRYSILIMQGNNSTGNYGFFKLAGLHDVTINGARLIGDLYTHTVPVTGNYGHSIMIYGCKNVVINDANITQSTGDGIYEARGGSGGINSNNLVFNNPLCNFNGRNGISATGVDTLLIVNPVTIGNTFTSPYTGIDLEPNTNLDNMSAITIINHVSRDNSPVSNHALGLGLSIGLKRLFYVDAAQKTANLNKVVNITILNNSDCGSGVGLKVSQSILKGSTISLTGHIIVSNPTFSTNLGAANSVDIASTGLLFDLYNPTVFDATGKPLTGNTALLYLLHNQTPGVNINNSLLPKP